MLTPDPQQRIRDNFGERAVSPVLGVILPVTIAVMLSAVIRAFAFGLGDRVQDYGPSTSFKFDYSPGDQMGECILSNDDDSNEGKVTITKEAGDDIDESQPTIVGKQGNSAGWNSCPSASVTEITSGDQATPEIDANDTLRLLRESENDNDDTTIVAKYEGPDA